VARLALPVRESPRSRRPRPRRRGRRSGARGLESGSSAPGPESTSRVFRARRRSPAASASNRSPANADTTTSFGSVARTASPSVASGVSAPRNRMRQPCERSTRPNAIRPMSWRSPGAQARMASGPLPRPHRRARPSSRSRTRFTCEVLLPDLELAALPGRADVTNAGKDQVAQHGLERVSGERCIERRMHGGFVVCARSSDQQPPGRRRALRVPATVRRRARAAPPPQRIGPRRERASPARHGRRRRRCTGGTRLRS
jgi:hypothetical protein